MQNPYMSRWVSADLISDALDAAHPRGMRLLVRMDFLKAQRKVAEEHPDWLYVSPKGEWQTTLPVSLTSLYQVDGFFVNWAGFDERDHFKVYHDICHCESCRARWRNREAARRRPHPGESGQIRFQEANNAMDREMWHHAASETASSLTSYRPDLPVLVDSVSFVDMPYHMGSEEPSHFVQHLLQTISSGGNPVDSHLSERSKNEGLERYDVVILPNLGKPQSEDASTLDEWVDQGGRLIATGTNGVGDDDVAQLKALSTERQRDVITGRDSLWSTYFALEQNRTDQFYSSGPIVSIHGTNSLFEWKEHAESRYKTSDYTPFAPPEYAYGNIQDDERGCGINTVDKGKGIVIPFTVGRGHRELGLVAFRDLYEIILREDGGANKKVEFHIAEQVEVTFNANGSRLVVRLINMSGMRKRNFWFLLAYFWWVY
ncbi:hypothetical protein DL766_006252 [Monosporascus sp. MC13-8B]|uniref:Beta-galactosidase trimerisation domain-containing protein n=1 Tax=Monosporascus cannonballus TaxID=155416 RepID=A0ABY0GXT0_9PEZI|nr:hypothetical protein DL762_009439 [Monosporascus cannonballus]RYO84751.1 hypothetical protein DL763_007368 [Monosporascus cannonballus]RYP27703.1 hypothetical protein DL766_006252 [Monosporascus sp. MC13-8B]